MCKGCRVHYVSSDEMLSMRQSDMNNDYACITSYYIQIQM